MHWYDKALLVEPTLLDAATLARAVPQCHRPELWADVLSFHLTRWGIESAHQVALFLAQVGHESASFRELEESLNYGVEALERLFGRHRISLEQIQRYGRKPGQPANQRALGNILYGGAWGARNLGNVQPGDGWKYRGRGLIQLTGRSNYTRCSMATGLDLVNNPSLLAEDPEAAVEASLWFWRDRVTGNDIKTTTRQVNGGTNGLADRIERYKRALAVLEG